MPLARTACALQVVGLGMALFKARMTHAGFCVSGAFLPAQVHTHER